MQWGNVRAPETTRVVFIRHGRSTYNDAQRFQGRSDRSVLSEQGWVTARQTGRALHGNQFDAIYTSPLQRAMQTTQTIAAELHASHPDPVPCPALLEIDLPDWAGRTYASVRTELADDYRHWQRSPDTFAMTRKRVATYPVLDLYAQVRAFWHLLLMKHRGETVLTIAHGGSIKAAISTAIGLPAKHYHLLQQSNCGISVVDFSTARDVPPMCLQALNVTGHLGETLPKLKAGKQGVRVVLIPAESDRLPTPWLSALGPYQYWIDRSDAARRLAAQVESPMAFPLSSTTWDYAARTLAHAKTTVTVVAIVSTPFLYHLLETWLHVNASVSSKCAIAPNTATVIHFPHPDTPPILQTLNFVPPLT